MTVPTKMAAAVLASLLMAPTMPSALAAADTNIQGGTVVNGKLEATLDSGKNQEGDKFVMDLEPGWFHNKSVKGGKLEGHLEGVKSAAKFGKKGSMNLVFDDLVTPEGKTVPVQVRLVSALKAQGKKMRNAALIVGGAIAGHHLAKKMGKQHGGLMGAAAATAVVLSMPAGNVVIPKSTTLKVKFESPVDLGSTN